MMAKNPNWWSQAQQPSAFLSPSPCPSLFPQYAADNQEFPQSWSQLLMGGLASEEEKLGLSHFQSKKLENWEDQILSPSLRVNPSVVDVKQEVAQSRRLYGHGDDEFQTCRPSWSHQVMPVSSPRSCVTNLSSSNMLDFSNNKIDGRNQHPDHSPECNSTATGGVPKKARVQSSSTQPPLKVRKEKLGDRITALHQLVSPFGKTDTASVLLEVIGYIGFLQSQIEALSSPYFCNASANLRHQQSVQGERNCTLVVDSGQGNQEAPKDLRSRGLCLVPVSCTHHVGNDNGADYWAPALGGGF
ncbi:Transcription factor bHLH68 [Camellia lanceoleosa]|uniref:Transcription factor bHLH68 n=1 Tax=Camellia lanceoleosa TaxID=1840588 RepID=A0ACC0FF57_9ERIC|nr:Transcription factor bHLH68 [Camellia lanceoleosa]